MTKTEIIAELRRSAVEDAFPWKDIAWRAFAVTRRYWAFEDFSGEYDFEQDGTFFLIVACALESE